MINYDIYSDLKDNRNIIRNSNTRYYWLADDVSKIDNPLVLAHFYKRESVIFVNSNQTDSYYLINRGKPSIGLESQVIQTNREIDNLYDIVFISHKEPNANDNYDRLQALGLRNKIHWVKDITGRNKAYKEAARVSNTRYFFAVFAKIEVDSYFDFTFGCEDWDYNHYVFKSINPVNGLIYGHQAIILYNKDQVLINPGNAIDFTMAQPYRTIDRICGIARYNTSPINAWRASFREVLKLKSIKKKTEYQFLNTWLTGSGDYAEFSIKGAKDGIAFHENYGEDPNFLMLSYDYNTLDNLFNQK